MNEVELCRDIRTRLEEDLANLQLEIDSAAGGLKAPQVVNGYLAPKGTTTTPDFPYVIVRPSKGQTGNDRMSTVDVKLLIGCYSEAYDGYEFCLLVLDFIRRSFAERPTVGSVFRFEFPMDWDLFDDQPYPEWVLEATTSWTVATPQEIPDEGVFDNGT